MKKSILLIAAIIISFVAATPQSCLPEGITFSTQEQIDNFQTNYPGCTEIEGNVTIQGAGVTNLNGLNVLTSIGGGLALTQIQALNSLTGLESLTSIGSFLYIGYGIALTSLTGLDNLTSIGGDLVIERSTSLKSLTGLSSLTTVGGLFEISHIWCFINLTGLEGLTSIGGDMMIKSNQALTSLTGLNNLTSIKGNLIIEWNASLNSLSGLENLTSIEKNIKINFNYGLSSLTGLEGLNSITGYLDIGRNALISYSGLNNLTSIGGDLLSWSNLSMSSLSGLENLTSVGGKLWISDNWSLTSLEGLYGLSEIVGSLTILGNSSLTSLAGLDSIPSGSITELDIRYNFSLSTCHVQSICSYLIAPNGTVTISDNAPGCNNPEEVIEACESSSIEVIPVEDGFTVFPNPFTDQLSIELSLDKPSLVAVTVYNNMGQLVEWPIEKELYPGVNQLQWDSSILPPGIYLLHLQVGREIVTRKIIKY